MIYVLCDCYFNRIPISMPNERNCFFMIVNLNDGELSGYVAMFYVQSCIKQKSDPLSRSSAVIYEVKLF
jgi:hypothetical protein